MIAQADIFGFDFPSLAQQLCDPKRHSSHNLYINDLLLDVRKWCGLGEAEIVRRFAENPVAVAAAWELIQAGEAISAESPSEASFLAKFCDWSIVNKMAYLGLNPLPDADVKLPRAIMRPRLSKWSGLVFIQDVARWAHRFAHVEPYNLREINRINRQFPFCTAVLEDGLSAEERIIHIAIEQLGVQVVMRDQQVAAHHLPSWLAEILGAKSTSPVTKQTQLDFKEAGGTRNSVYVVRAVGGVDGFDVRGTIGPDLGLIIDISDREINSSSTAYIEEHVIRVINENTPLSAELTDGSLRLRWFDNRLTAEDLGSLIHQALKNEFILSTISVKLIFDSMRLSSIKPQIYAYVEDRNKQLQRRVEEKEPLAVCTDCRSYSPHAFCIASADRPPCCGRSYDELATTAQFTHNTNQIMLERGVCQDRLRGSYIGAQKTASIFSENVVNQINLHSIRENPHPTTAIPQCIAYYRADLDIICIISKDYTGRSPDGKTFTSLLQRVAGLQSPGFVGISEAYILSPRFFNSEGGFARIGWMNSALKLRLAVKADHIATEKDCTNIGGLKDFLSAWRN